MINNKEEKQERIMTKQGYDELLLKYAKLKAEIAEIRQEVNENVLKGADEQSPSLQSLQSRYNIKCGEVQRISEKLDNITIVDKINNENLVDVDDVLNVALETDGESEIITVKITEVLNDIEDESIEPVLINSPMGRALYGKELGEKREFKVGGNTMHVTALSKVEIKENNKKNPVRIRTEKVQSK